MDGHEQQGVTVVGQKNRKAKFGVRQKNKRVLLFGQKNRRTKEQGRQKNKRTEFKNYTATLLGQKNRSFFINKISF